MKRIKIEDIQEVIEDAMVKELEKGIDSVEVKLSCHPPYMDRLSSESDEIRFDDINLRKIVKDYISDRDGTIELKDEIQWLNEWAREFDYYSKKMIRKAIDLSKRLK